MRKIERKRGLKVFDESTQQKYTNEDDAYYKLSRTFADNFFHSSQHNKIIVNITEQMKRPQTSKKLRNDYRTLLNLVHSNKKVLEIGKKSIASYNEMRKIKQRESSPANMYKPLFEQIQNGQQAISKKRYQKYDLQKFQIELKKKNTHNPFDQLVENIIYQGMRQLRNFVPLEANFHKKLLIFGEMMEQQKSKHMQNVKKMLIKQKQRTPSMNKSYQIYLINHYLLQELMVKINESAAGLQLKKKNSQLYFFIKNEMVAEMVHEKGFSRALQILDEHFLQSQKISINMQNRKIVNSMTLLGTRRKQRMKSRKFIQKSDSSFEIGARLTTKGKQNDISFKFESLYNHAQSKLAQAEKELAFPQKRKNIFFSVIDNELSRQHNFSIH